MLPKAAASPRCLEMFLREVENTRALRHPNVVRFLDAGYSAGTFFFAMEYCDAGALDRLIIDKGGKLPVDEATAVLFPMLDGIEYAHRAELPYVQLQDGSIGVGKGLVHRDISPHNVLLSNIDQQCQPKVSDFGLSKAFDLAGLSGLTCTGAAAGKPFYMCRQQLIDYPVCRS